MKQEVLGVKAPEKECTDKKCPFHGQLNVKKETFKGVVIKKDINHSATVEWFRSTYVPKFERYKKGRSRMRVHNPACLNAEIGQEVLVARTRPLSKVKNHVIIQILGEKLIIDEPEVDVHAQTKVAQKATKETEQEKRINNN
jgi:small subunit ribosomal protein S17